LCFITFHRIVIFSTHPFCREQGWICSIPNLLLMSTAEPSPPGITRSWSRWLGKNAAGRFTRQPVFLGRIFPGAF
jgi:hypothetical protein